ncbi:hypothetical protein BDN71DRAFT_1590971 [Pleurotus eryngii]|uniref:Uncharacterized protein n=1 Tax=Pleurotus eryngii TaxID=5323 RepID=A0A9P5ZSD7_PLEER|nr:hypothetical protein BDN71DRAFT_1590971 [Pleurotus eryngii]
MPQDADQVERAPLLPHRHAAPSGPWPRMDLGSTIRPEQLSSEQPPVPEPCDHSSCKGACREDDPRSRFPDWEKDQTERAKSMKQLLCPKLPRALFSSMVANRFESRERRSKTFGAATFSGRERREGSMPLREEYDWSRPPDVGRKEDILPKGGGRSFGFPALLPGMYYSRILRYRYYNHLAILDRVTESLENNPKEG